MKKLISVIVACVMVTAFSGMASAAFDEGALKLTVYEQTGPSTAGPQEKGIDLLDLSTWSFGMDNWAKVATGAFSTADFTTSPTWADLSAGSFGYAADTKMGFFATTTDIAPGIGTRKGTTFKSANTSTSGYYEGVGGNPVMGETGNPNSYWTKMNSGAAPGQYAGLNLDNANGEAKLGNIEQDDVIMYLWKVDMTDSRRAILAQDSPVAMMKLTANGDVYVTNAVPIPGAVWLLGSALLGLVGIRKKKA